MHDLIVVGAGFSGLAAATEAVDAGLDVVVLEARDRVGGRTRNEAFADGALIESGGQWVGPTQHEVLRLADQHGVERYPTPEDGEHVSRYRGELRTFTGDTFGMPPRVQVEALLTQKRLERIAATVPLDAPWAAPDAEKLDAQTLESWLRRNVLQAEARDVFRLIAAALFSAEASQLSLLHWSFYLRSGGMLDDMLATDGGAQMWRLHGGTNGLAQRVADALGDRVLLDHAVHAIEHDDDGVTVTTGNGSTHRARRLVVAVPPHLVNRLHVTPALPARRAQLVQSVPMGAVVKAHLRYDRRFWVDEGHSGFGASLDHPVSLTFDNTPPDVDGGILMGFVEGAHARSFAALDEAGQREVVVEGVVALLGPSAADPLEVHLRDWAAERWSGGCYGGHLAPGVWTQLGPELRRPVGPIHWAGTETATTWNGYIDGAISAGRRAAREVVAAIGSGTGR